MALNNTYIPYGTYWSTPFCRWQGSLASEHSMKLAAKSAQRFLEQREISPESFDGLMLGISVPQRSSFYGAPWIASMIGAGGITGPTIAQACATGTRMLAMAALEVETGQRECILTVGCDRTSNSPNVYYPDPKGIGGVGQTEAWVLDNFNGDPATRKAMIVTAENVAKAEGITREEQDDVALMRSEQYVEALADDRAFQKRFMLPVTIGKGKRAKEIEADEGVFPSTKEGLTGLRPMLEGGTVTFGSQTHPCDANAGIVVCNEQRANSLSTNKSVKIQVLSYGEARVDATFMPRAVVPAAEDALKRAGVKIEDCKAIKTHNPFAVNDVYFSRQTGVPLENVNRYGSPLVYGHPQAPLGQRVVIELIEELVEKGGGLGLFSGCAAGDTAMALVIKVS